MNVKLPCPLWKGLIATLLILFSSCQSKPGSTPVERSEKVRSPQYAKGFYLEQKEDFTLLHILNPWPGDAANFTYALVPKSSELSSNASGYDGIIRTPVRSLVVTSTTHIPALEELEALDRLLGFPGTRYISSEAARKKIGEGLIKELGPNGQLNVEEVLALHPELVIAYGMGPDNRSFESIKRAGIPVVINGDWMEQHPLGKAEWIQFFGILLGKEKEASAYFEKIEEAYMRAKELVRSVEQRPVVISGAVYKDVWYAPAGNSWAATFLKDAGADYLWQKETGTGSLSLSLEAALTLGAEADLWIAPSQFTSYSEMQESSTHYGAFQAFKNKKVFTFAKTKGSGGGVLYYELAPYRPDAVLMDLIHCIHPDRAPGYEPLFFHPLDP